MKIADLNVIAPDQLKSRLLECCGSEKWVAEILSGRPFFDKDTLQRRAAEAWWSLAPEDWLEAFSKHPRIGEKRNLSKWSSEEQKGMAEGDSALAAKIVDLNRVYEERFGWVFIVSATGKSAAEMLNLLETRLDNAPADELRIAADEHEKIMHLRIEKLLAT